MNDRTAHGPSRRRNERIHDDGTGRKQFRFFVPTHPHNTLVYCWMWRLGHGLVAIFNDGVVMKSDYTLRELMSRSNDDLDSNREIDQFPIDNSWRQDPELCTHCGAKLDDMGRCPNERTTS